MRKGSAVRVLKADLAHILPDRVFHAVHNVRAARLCKVGRGIDQHELSAKEVGQIVGLHVRGLVGTVRVKEAGKLVFDLALVKDAEHVECHFADAVVLTDNKHDLIGARRPMATLADQLILLIEQVLIAEHFTHHAEHARLLDHTAHAREHVAHVVEDLGGADARCAVGGVDLQIKVVGVFDVADRVLDLVVMLLQILLEGNEVVLDSGSHRRHHRAERVVYVDLVGVRIFDIVLGNLHHSREHRGVVGGRSLKGQRIGREGVLLHRINVSLNTVGQRENERDANDTDASRKRGQNGTTLFGQKVVFRKREGGGKGHRGLLCGLFLGSLGGLCRLLVSLFGNLFFFFGLCEQSGKLVVVHGCGVGEDQTVLQAHDAGRVFFGQLGVVRDHDDEAVAGDLLEKLHDLHARLRVKRTGRLVGKQNVGVIDKGAGDRNALHLSARHLVRLFLELIAKTDLAQRLNGASTALVARNTRKRECKLDVREYRLVGDQVIALENEADRVVAVGVPVAVGKFLGGATVDYQISARVAVKTADNVEHRGFATARRTEDRHEFVRAEAQAYTAERVDRRVARYVLLGNLF